MTCGDGDTLAAITEPIPDSDPRQWPVGRGEFPWSVAVMSKLDGRIPVCSGTLVAASWVLTAAQCVGK